MISYCRKYYYFYLHQKGRKEEYSKAEITLRSVVSDVCLDAEPFVSEEQCLVCLDILLVVTVFSDETLSHVLVYAIFPWYLVLHKKVATLIIIETIWTERALFTLASLVTT